MPERVGIRQLRNQLATVVRRAGQGDRIVVTVDGQPIAQLGPVEPDGAGPTVDDLIATGLLDPPATAERHRPAPEPVGVEVRVSAVLHDLRGR